jgi:hypothetical protein
LATVMRVCASGDEIDATWAHQRALADATSAL